MIEGEKWHLESRSRQRFRYLRNYRWTSFFLKAERRVYVVESRLEWRIWAVLREKTR
jgi:hypothetical protein